MLRTQENWIHVSWIGKDVQTCFQVNKTISAPSVINHLTDTDSDIHPGPYNNHIHPDGFYLRYNRVMSRQATSHYNK